MGATDTKPKLQDISAYTVDAVKRMVEARKLPAGAVLWYEKRHRRRPELIEWLTKEEHDKPSHTGSG